MFCENGVLTKSTAENSKFFYQNKTNHSWTWECGILNNGDSIPTSAQECSLPYGYC